MFIDNKKSLEKASKYSKNFKAVTKYKIDIIPDFRQEGSTATSSKTKLIIKVSFFYNSQDVK